MPAHPQGQLCQTGRDPRIHPRPCRYLVSQIGWDEGETHSGMAVAFDTRKLQSNIRRLREVSSTTSLGIACGRAGLDSASVEADGLRTADEAFPVRGKREGRLGRGHNLAGRRKVFQKEDGMVGPLTRLTS